MRRRAFSVAAAAARAFSVAAAAAENGYAGGHLVDNRQPPFFDADTALLVANLRRRVVLLCRYVFKLSHWVSV